MSVDNYKLAKRPLFKLPQENEIVLALQEFKRSINPLVSVLIPSRGRPIALQNSIYSLIGQAADPSVLEFILKIDSDDPATINMSTQLSRELPVRVIVSPRGNGYHDMHHWVNEMCAIAQGDWLLLFNDDARMKTKDWDKILLSARAISTDDRRRDICSLIAQTYDRLMSNEFCFLRRKVYEVLGHYSMSPYNDEWINSLMSFLHSCYVIPVEIEHHDQIQDETRRATQEAYQNSHTIIASSQVIKAKLDDINKLLGYLNYDDVLGKATNKAV